MVKNPNGSMDEEEIIKRRDGVASNDPLAPQDRRALADARLRALAFALGAEQSAREEADEVSDTDLLAYLLDALAPDGRQRLEHAARGDSHIFSRLMTLRLALDQQPDQRDRRHTEDLARAIRRHIASRVAIRPSGELLQFKEGPVLGGLAQTEQFAFRTAAEARLPVSVPPPPARPQRRSDREAEPRLLSVLERTRSHLDAGQHLIHEMEALLERPEGTDRREGSRPRNDDLSRRGNIERVTKQLRELLHQFQIIAKTTSMIMTSVEAASGREPLFLQMSQRIQSTALMRARVPDDYKTWADAIGVQAGPWSLNLSGTALPTPRLRVALDQRKHEALHSEPFLTLVRPGQGFETATTDSEGRASFPLPAGASVLLLQHDEVWEIRLLFRNGGRASLSRRFYEE
jgi:hypothetical protein